MFKIIFVHNTYNGMQFVHNIVFHTNKHWKKNIYNYFRWLQQRYNYNSL